ncbi:hypothetical protein [Streptomyces olivaceus]|uniref:hypothetical protein n=1 Tax=Streptomyces olivaceus TaxID=47716 RepID=UPI001CCFE405|nr:hypothetical protein [Streptomyces olivaceus]MBZ6135528.1 hypothetical protein [Streptomyces olivaceus]
MSSEFRTRMAARLGQGPPRHTLGKISAGFSVLGAACENVSVSQCQPAQIALIAVTAALGLMTGVFSPTPPAAPVPPADRRPTCDHTCVDKAEPTATENS